MNNRQSANRILDFIQFTTYDSLDESVRKQAVKCFLDLSSVICAGAKNNTAKCATNYVLENYPMGGGENPIRR